MSNDVWNNNLIQFARLIAELNGTDMGESIWDSLLDAMGLESDQLSELFERAQDIYMRETNLNLGAQQPRWVVQHQNDLDPTYIIDAERDPDGEEAFIELAPGIPWEIRLPLARMIALIMNVSKDTAPKDAIGLRTDTTSAG